MAWVRITSVGLSFLLLTGCLLMAGCKKATQQKQLPSRTVTVRQPEQRKISEHVKATGVTDSIQSVTLQARVDGYLERIEFAEGEIVEQGKLLFVIQKAPFETALESAEAQRAKAEAAVRLARQEYKRLVKLRRRNATTEEELEQHRADLARAQAEVQATEAALRQAKLDLKYTEIRAPFTGEMGETRVDVGALVRAQTTELATIEQSQPIYAYFFVDERDFLRLRKAYAKRRSEPSTQIPAVPLQLQTVIESDYPHKGVLDFRAPRVDTGTGTIRVRGRFPNKDRELIPGLFVRILASVGDPRPRLLIDNQAINTDQRGDYLLIVKDDNTVERRSVETGPLQGSMRVVHQGLQPNDWVVVKGLQRARPGIQVDPQRQTAEPSAEPDRKD